MSTRLPQPFRYRGRWRAQVTLKNGERPSEDFDTFAQAKTWIADMLANSNTENEPLLGGPTQARLADMLDHYVRHTTLAKGGAVQEINRANHYLVAAGLPELALWESADGTKAVVTLTRKHAMKREERGDTAAVTPQKRRGPRSEAGVLPSGFAQHNEVRSRASHPRTYELYATLANKRASQITGADMRVLHTTMTAEGYSASTIQKEIALLKALFNESQANWHWPIARNPCAGIQLKQGNRRFVVFTDEQRVRLTEALAQCDNPQFWPLVDFTMETALRQSTLLRLRWEDVSFEDRKLFSLGKGQLSFIPLSKRAIQILEGLPGPHVGLIFPLSAESIRQAWTRIRKRAGLEKLLFRDLRHIAPTSYAREGLNAFQIRDILGHKTTTQADIYVNLANRDILDAMDRIDAKVRVALPLPPETSWDTLRGQNKARRLKKVDIPLVVVEHDSTGESASTTVAPTPATAPAPSEKPFMATRLTDNVIPFKPRSPLAQPTGTTTPASRPLLQQNGN